MLAVPSSRSNESDEEEHEYDESHRIFGGGDDDDETEEEDVEEGGEGERMNSIVMNAFAHNRHRQLHRRTGVSL